MNNIAGLYGQIGTGKSTVSEYLKKSGWDYINQDKLGHEVLQEYSKELAEHLKINVKDVEDRPKFSRMVFEDTDLLGRLVEFSYPIIIQKTINLIKDKNTVIEGAFFYKVKDSIPHNHLIYISVERDILIQRLLKRGHDIDWIYKVLESQTDIADNQGLADFRLDNSGRAEDLYKSIDIILGQML